MNHQNVVSDFAVAMALIGGGGSGGSIAETVAELVKDVETLSGTVSSQGSALSALSGAVDDVSISKETVSGATPTITGEANTIYMCGTVTSISITPPQSGLIDVIFTSGTTAATLTVPNTVRWPAWFDPSSLDASTTYELSILDGVYGVVTAWV